MLTKIKAHHQSRNYFKKFADKADLVYFGPIDRDDEVYSYRGVTFSEDSLDSNYMHGTINRYDVSVFQRSATHVSSDKESSKNSWSVVAIHLKETGFPHLILDARKHDKVFYNMLLTKFPRLKRAGDVMSRISQTAAQNFDLYTSAYSTIPVMSLLDDSLLKQITINYAGSNIELDGATLMIFKRDLPASVKELSDMLNQGLWLAEVLEMRHAYSENAIPA